MKPVASHAEWGKYLRFLVGGGINTAFTYALYFFLQRIWSYQLAYAIAFATGILFSFWFNSRVVFGTAMSWKRLLAYPVVYVVQYAAAALLLNLLVERLGISRIVAPLLILIVTIPLTYALTKFILHGRNRSKISE